MNVMIVDDSNMIRIILKGLLKQLSILTVFEARNGEEALELLQTQSLDLLLLDLHMPKMDGFELMEEINKNRKDSNVKILILSSDAGSDQVEKARSLGATGYVTKPFRIASLRAAMEEAGCWDPSLLTPANSN